MAHPPPYPGSGDDSGAGPVRGPANGAPRWISVLKMIIAIALLVLVLVLHLSGIIGPRAHSVEVHQ